MMKNIRDIHLCKLSSGDIQKNFGVLVQLVEKPKFFCRKCARVANRAANLCKAEKLKSLR
jgi:hypothetical protein